ncbi:MAG: acylphosphatase [Dehalococcoidia bacterium]
MSEEPKVSLHATARGRVQGVGFRDFVCARARSLGLTGYVKNVRDDHRAVEVVAEGPRSALERLVEQLRDGPRSARVDAVDQRWGEATGEFDGFDVRF